MCLNIVTAEKILSIDTSKSYDYEKTNELMNEFKNIRENRHPLFIDFYDFEKILRWKLRGQYGRQKSIRTMNTDKIIRTVTGACFAIRHFDENYELDMKVGILCVLRGVGVPVASAILTLIEPERYGVIDFRGWRQIFGVEKRIFSLSDYRQYMRRIRELAAQTKMNPQAIDYAIWSYDAENNGSA